MKLAVISPVSHLNTYSALGDFDFALAHVALEAKENERYEEYVSYFRNQAKSNKLVYLDNGAHESSRVGYDELINIANDMEATHLICPDVLGNGVKTEENTMDFIAEYSNSTDARFIGVAQGATWDEFLDCFEYMVKEPKIQLIGIPYDVTFPEIVKNKQTYFPEISKTMLQRESRIEALQRLKRENKLTKGIHLLGWSHPLEIMQPEYQFIPEVFSNDTQGYLVYGQHFVDTQITDEFNIEAEINSLAFLHDKIPTDPDFWREIPNKYENSIKQMIGYYLEYLRAPYKVNV